MSTDANPVQTAYDGLVIAGMPWPGAAPPSVPGAAWAKVPGLDLWAQVTLSLLDPVQAKVAMDSRAALKAALDAVSSAIVAPNGLAADILGLTAAVESLGPIVQAQADHTAELILEQRATNGCLQRLCDGSDATLSLLTDVRTLLTSLVASSQSVATNTGATASSAAATAVGVVSNHTDLALLHGDLQALGTGQGAGNTALSALLALSQKEDAEGDPYSASATTATTTTLLAASATGWRLGSLVVDCTGLLAGLAGVARVTLFHAATPTATGGTAIGTYDVPFGGAPVAVDLDVAIPAGRTVRFTNAVGQVAVSAVARPL